MLELALRAVAFVLGAWLVGVAMDSAIRTYVMPRGVPDRLSRALFRALRRLFDLRTRRARDYAARDQAMAMYAPVGLVLLAGFYLVLTLIAFTAIFWGLGVPSWQQAFTISGSSILTLGFATTEDPFKTVVVFTESAIGL